MEALKNMRKALDSMPFIATLLLVIFADGIFGGLYRMTRGDTFGIVVGVIWIAISFGLIGIFGGIGSIALAILEIIDVISVLVKKKITVLA